MLFIDAIHTMETGEWFYMAKHAYETGSLCERLLCNYWSVSAALALFLTTLPLPHYPYSSQATAPVLACFVFLLSGMLQLLKAVFL